VIEKLYQYLSGRPGGADSEELLELVFGAQGGDPTFGREFLSALLADDPRFIADADGTRWRTTDKHLLNEPLSDAPFVVVDLETTGQHPDEAGITEIGAVRLCGAREVDRYETLVNPGKPIPPYVAMLTGITDAMVAGAPAIEQVVPAFASFAAGAIIVAHNAAFDVAVLDRASRRVLGRPLGLPSLCTFKLARRLRPEDTRASLDGLAAHFALAKSARHRALADAELTVAVLLRLVRLLEEGDGSRTVSALLDAQENEGAPRRLEIHVPRHRFEALPEGPGVFWLLDDSGQALFVGQAANVRARVVTYVSGRAHLSDRQFEMISATADVGCRPAANSLERALIEAQEIRRQNPLFNRADKHLPRGSFVKVQRRGRFARVLVASRVAGDGALYLGPLKSRTFADDAVALVAKTFRLRTCAGGLRPSPAVEPCWLGPAGWCASPCNAAINANAYRALVDEAARALENDPTVLRNPTNRARTDKAQDQSRDSAVVGRLMKIHRKRHWLVNAHSYVAAFPATEGGLWVAVVLGGLCRRLRNVKNADELGAALTVDAQLDAQRRVTPFEADASTILAYWIRRQLADDEIVAIDVDSADLASSFAAVRDELQVLVADS
jgi:DNA polymerase-3 subunit epsilon